MSPFELHYTIKNKKETQEELTTYLSLLELLLKNGAKIHHGSGGGVWNYVTDLRQAKLLVKYNRSELNVVDDDGKTALHVVVKNKNCSERCEKEKIIRYLL
jgi:ankyrin repeat protein